MKSFYNNELYCDYNNINDDPVKKNIYEKQTYLLNYIRSYDTLDPKITRIFIEGNKKNNGINLNSKKIILDLLNSNILCCINTVNYIFNHNLNTFLKNNISKETLTKTKRFLNLKKQELKCNCISGTNFKLLVKYIIKYKIYDIFYILNYEEKMINYYNLLFFGKCELYKYKPTFKETKITKFEKIKNSYSNIVNLKILLRNAIRIRCLNILTDFDILILEDYIKLINNIIKDKDEDEDEEEDDI